MFITDTNTASIATRDLARAITTKGFGEISLDPQLLKRHVPRIVEGIRLITDSVPARRFFPPQVVGYDEMRWAQDAGLMYRCDEERKFVFQYPIPCATWPDLNGVEPYLPFLDSCKALTLRAKKIVAQVTAAIDALNGDRAKRRYPTRLVDMLENAYAVTRVLRYLQRSDTHEPKADAYPHIDRGFLTIHWWASAPGLSLFDREGKKWEIGEETYDSAGIFPGKKFYALSRGIYGPIGVHGVRDARIVRTDDRIAIVTFVHANLSPEDVAFLIEKLQFLKDAEARYVI